MLQELRRRNVFRVALAYLILGWVVVQAAAILAPALLLPDWTLSLVVFFGIIGFPFALNFAWAYELTPEGLKPTGAVDPIPLNAHVLDGQCPLLAMSRLWGCQFSCLLYPQ